MPNLTVNDILTDAYQEANATPEYKSGNTLGLKHLHLITQDFWGRAVKYKKANRNWDIWFTDTLALQDEYTKPAVSSTDVGAQHIETLSITYNSKTYDKTGNPIYIPCREATDFEIRDWNYYLENQSNDSPIFFQRDGSVFIAPDPRSTEVGTNRIKITGIRSIASGSWTTSTSETEIKLPIFALDVLKLGLVWKIMAYLRRERNDVLSAFQEYDTRADDAVNKMFTEESFYNQYPDV